MALSQPVKSVILAEKPPGIWRMSDQARGAAMPATKTEIFPYIFYHNVPAALKWLTRAFGFKEEMRTTPPDGGMHAEMSLGDQRIMMGQGSKRWGMISPARALRRRWASSSISTMWTAITRGRAQPVPRS